jgi:hypothetical protein
MFRWFPITSIFISILASFAAPFISGPIPAQSEIRRQDVQPLRYNPDLHEWSFSGEVLETRQVFIMGLASQVARVQSRDFEAWVILRMDSQSAELDEIVLMKADEASNDSIGIGDQVRVSISGAHVSKNGVNWDLCQPISSNYCRQGGLYDTGPLSGDWNMPLSPSNEFIHSGRPNPSMELALFWNTEKLSIGNSHSHQRYDLPGKSQRPRPGPPGCLALHHGNLHTVSKAAPDDAGCLSSLVEISISRTDRKHQHQRDLSLVIDAQLWPGRSRISFDAAGNLLARDAYARLLQFSQ